MFINVNSSDWFVDSGASQNHMCNNANNLVNFQTNVSSESITTANNQILKSKGKGDYIVQLQGHNEPSTIKNVPYIPNLAVNLLSVSKLVENGFSVVFTPSGCTIYHDETFT